MVELTSPHSITRNLCYPWHIAIHRLRLCFFCLLKTPEEGDTPARRLLDPQSQKNHYHVEEGSERNPVCVFSTQKTLGQRPHTIEPIKIQSGGPYSLALHVRCRLRLHGKLLRPARTKSGVKLGESYPRGLRAA